jgi:hypothetical protein
MRRPWEHVNRCSFHDLISVKRKQLDVAGQSGGVAGNVDNAFRRHFRNRLNQRGIAALARRVKNNHVGTNAAVFQHICRFCSVSAQKFRVFDAVFLSVFLRVFHGLLHNFHADYMFGLLCHGKPDGSGAAIEVQNRFLTGQSGVFSGQIVETFRLTRVHLIERLGRDAEPQAAENIGNVVLPASGAEFFAENHVCLVAVYVDDKAFQSRHSLFEQVGKFLFVMHAVSVYHNTGHNFAGCLSFAQEQMAQAAAPGGFIIDAVARFAGPFAESLHRRGEFLRLEQAFFAVDDAVAVYGIEAERNVSVCPFSDGKLRLVAVAVRFICADDRLQHGIMQTSDAFQSVLHTLLFCGQFRLIRDVAIGASAAPSKLRAIYGDSVL